MDDVQRMTTDELRRKETKAKANADRQRRWRERQKEKRKAQPTSIVVETDAIYVNGVNVDEPEKEPFTIQHAVLASGMIRAATELDMPDQGEELAELALDIASLDETDRKVVHELVLQRITSVGLLIDAYLAAQCCALAGGELSEGGLDICRRDVKRIRVKVERAAFPMSASERTAIQDELKHHDQRRFRSVLNWAESIGIRVWV